MTEQSASNFLDYCRGLDTEHRVSCRAMYFWNEARAGREMPRLVDVGFVTWPDLRDNMFILATGNGGGRFLIQRTCKALDRLFGADPTGKPLEKVLPAPFDGLARDCCEGAVLSRQPQIDGNLLTLSGGLELRYRMAFLPLSNASEGRVDHLLGAFSFRLG